MSAEPVVVKRGQARVFLEGPELCREYMRTEKIWFGTSTLHAGDRGAIDTGHPGAHEIFFVVTGHVLLLGDEEKYYELDEGDAILFPEGVPHTIINIGEVMATLIWAGGPS